MMTAGGFNVTKSMRLHLGAAATRHSSSVQRTSSGLRIEKAADDSAALAVAEGLKTSSLSKQQAMRNINDALSALDAADGGLTTISDLVKRMRELAIQSASETLSNSERAYVQEEYRHTMHEINVTATRTKWNDKDLLTPTQVDIGFIVDNTFAMEQEISELVDHMDEFRDPFTANGLNLGMGLLIANHSSDAIDDTTQLADIADGDFDGELASLSTASGLVDPWLSMTDAAGATAVAGTTEPDELSWRADSEKKVLVYIGNSVRENTFSPGLSSQSLVADALEDEDVEVHVINELGNSGDYTTITSQTGGQYWDIGDSTGSNIESVLSAMGTQIAETISADVGWDVQVSDGADGNSRMTLQLPLNGSAAGLGLDGTNVLTAKDAQAALDKLDVALDRINQGRSTIASQQNRLQFSMATEQAALESNQTGESLIRDVDFAFETAEMMKFKIQEDSATAMLSQAHSMGQQAIRTLLG